MAASTFWLGSFDTCNFIDRELNNELHQALSMRAREGPVWKGQVLLSSYLGVQVDDFGLTEPGVEDETSLFLAVRVALSLSLKAASNQAYSALSSVF